MRLKIVSGVVGGLLTAILGWVLVAMSISHGSPVDEQLSQWGFYLFGSLGLIVALTSPRAAKAWRRIFFISSIISFLFILSLLSPLSDVDISTMQLFFDTRNGTRLVTVEGFGIMALFSFLGIILFLGGVVTGKKQIT